MSLRKSVELVQKNKRFLITSHTNPEGDSLGSELAMRMLLQKLGKYARIVNEDDVPENYRFLPGSDGIIKYRQNLDPRDFDVLVVLDCADLKRTGEVYRMNQRGKPILNIDHHISNVRFGAVNWIMPQASSCAELIYALYRRLRVPFDHDAAVCLYAGMVTDTGSFRYANTTAATHRAVACLMRTGIDVPGVYRAAYEDVSYKDMQLLAAILPHMRREAGGKIIWFEGDRRMLKRQSQAFDLTEHVLGFARAIKGVEVVALFKENLGVRNEIRVNLRSRGTVDVNRIAAQFGGGGHRTASGATVHGELGRVRAKVLAAIRKSLR